MSALDLLARGAAFFPTIDVEARVQHGLEYKLEFFALVVSTYLVAVFAMKKFIQYRGKPYDLKMALSVWNFFLAGTSAYLFSWMVTTIADTYTNQVDSLWELTCDPNRRLETASYTAPLYVIFLTKYLELVDTAFLCLREKPTPFIHVYHHAITICFMWMHLVNHTCVCWLMSTINVGVHVLLYTYYGLAALGIDIWFKRYLTMIQITQFVATLVPSVVVLAARTLWETNPSMGDSCNGSWFSAIVGSAILLSYLYLFLDLYLQRFDKSGRDRKRMHQQTTTPSSANPVEGVLLKKDGDGRTHHPLQPTTGDQSPQHSYHAPSMQYPSPTAALSQMAQSHGMQPMAAAEMHRRAQVNRRHADHAGGS